MKTRVSLSRLHFQSTQLFLEVSNFRDVEMVQLEMTDSQKLPQLLKPTGLGHDFPAEKLLGEVFTGFHNATVPKVVPKFCLTIFSELAETTKAEGFIAKDLDEENYAHAPEAQKVGHKDKLFPKTPIINVQSAQEAFSDKVNFI